MSLSVWDGKDEFIQLLLPDQLCKRGRNNLFFCTHF